MKKNRWMKRILTWLLCAALVLPMVLQGSVRAEAETTSTGANDRPIIVSLGDSYSSGEGIEPFYGQDSSMGTKCREDDWLAHRSKNAWSGMLTLPNVGRMSDHRNENWYFVASSGATTEHIRRTGTKVVNEKTGEKEGEQRKDYDRDGIKGYKMLPGQLDVFYNTPGLDRYDVDYVTITIGGNDVDFVGVLKQAHHTILSTAMYDFIDDKLNHFYDEGGIYYKLRDAYKRIEEAAPNATILVAGYPELLDYSGKGAAFNRYESEYINWAVRILNNRIAALITECRQDGMKIEFVDVASQFQGHQAYSDDAYINPIYYFPDIKSQDLKGFDLTSSYSMHPNYWGAQRYAAAVQEKLNLLENERLYGQSVRETSDVRDVVLVLDTSGSMDGYKLRETKEAACSFIETVLQNDASVGIVSYDDAAAMRADFSMSEQYLKDTVNAMYTGGSTNTDAGLQTAEQMLQESHARKRIIVLMSDGEANEGRTDDALTAYANELKDQGIIIYTLGFFDGWGSSYAAQRSMEGIASPGCHFEVDEAENLQFFFEDVADQLNGTPYIYVRVACPVDVEVTYNGETLSSNQNLNRTSFGSLTYEDGEGDSWYGDNRTKILRLREGVNYQIDITGNGEGTMNYTVRYMDGEGEYTDVREIKDVEIRPETQIRGNSTRSESTKLWVDYDGDGRIDDTLDGGGGEPAEKDLSFLIWIGLGLLVLAAAVVVTILLLKRKKNAGPKPPKAPKPPKQPKPQTPPAYPGTPVPPAYAGTPAGLKYGGAKKPSGFCGSCGAPLDGKSAFCGSCGAKVR